VREQRERGVSPEALVGRLACSLSLLDHDEPIAARELVRGFSLAQIARRPVTMAE
jgi:hypothetical protein